MDGDSSDAMLEYSLCDADAGPKDPGAFTMLIDLHMAFGNVQLMAVWNSGVHFPFPNSIASYAVRALGASEQGCVGEQCCSASADIHNNTAREQV